LGTQCWLVGAFSNHMIWPIHMSHSHVASARYHAIFAFF